MSKIQSNEREFNSQVIVWLNEFISGGSYPFENITGETSVKAPGETTRFPDVQVWLNRAAKQGFCGWELKPPSIPADDPTLLENAAAKARAMNADHFVTWNMRNAILWRTPHTLIPVFAENRIKEYPPIPNINQPEDMWVKPNDILKYRIMHGGGMDFDIREDFKPTVGESGLDYQCIRSKATRGNIVDAIIQNLNDSYVILADLTDGRANVFYELGARHSLKDRTILLAQKREDIQFDLQAYAYHVYNWKTGFTLKRN